MKTEKNIAYKLLIVIFLGGLTNWLTFQFSKDFSGPITATLVVLLCTLIIKKNNAKWSNYGLIKVNKPIKLLWQVPLVMVFTIATGAIANKLFSSLFDSEVITQSRFEGIEGNVSLFLLWVIVGWIVGGFFEEMIFRGFFLNNFERLFAKYKLKTVLAIIAQAFLFGLIHFYNRGIVGGLTIFLVGIVFGGLYIKMGRTLWPLIIAHGIIDTLSFLEDFIG